jgi:hypothetical protein
MSTVERPEWVIKTLGKYVGKKTEGPVLPDLGRNMQAEILRLQAVIDTVSKHRIPATELVRLRNKAQDLLNILNSKQ